MLQIYPQFRLVLQKLFTSSSPLCLWLALLICVSGLFTTPAVAAAATTIQSVETQDSSAFDCTLAEGIDVNDCNVLITLYNQTDGPNWSVYDPDEAWLGTAPPCSWMGITCADERVSEIHLPYRGLNGELPPELGDLPNLESLTIRSEKLNGKIPAELGKLENLSHLDLKSSELSGAIPAELGQLSNLTYLDLEINQLSGEIPSELGQLSELTYLNLYNNELTGEIPSALGQLSNLADLRLHHNLLAGDIPPELGQLSNLTYLFLDNNQLSGLIPPQLGELSELIWLRLNHNQLSGEIPVELGQLSNLTDVDLSTNQLSGDFLVKFVPLTNLVSLDVADNRLTEAISDEFVCSPMASRMHRLDIQHNMITFANRDARVCLNSMGANLYPQTVPPTNLQAARISPTVVRLSWTSSPYSYYGYGYYEVGLFDEQSETYEIIATEIHNRDQTFLIQNFQPDQEYKFAVRTVTPAYESVIPNALISAFSAASETTQFVEMSNLYMPVNFVSASIPYDCTMAVDINEDDCEVLVAFYNQTGGPTWREQDFWLTGTTPCALWGGIKCTNRKVTSINLDYKNLQGEVPVVLSNLSNLTHLYLVSNDLDGEIPVELRQLDALELLDLSRNELSGEIPAELGELSALRTLRLGSNNLSGEIPVELEQLTALRTLSLSDNQLSGQIPPVLSQLANLSTLGLSRNRLSGPIPEEFAPLSTIESLNLSYNQLSGEIPNELIVCNSVFGVPSTRTKNLDIGGNMLSTTNESLATCLSTINQGWQRTQTVPPTNLQAIAESSTTIRLSWDLIPFTYRVGYYEIGLTADGGQTFAIVAATANKRESTILVENLEPNTTYTFAVRTFTDDTYVGQKNELTSPFGELITVQTPSQ